MREVSSVVAAASAGRVGCLIEVTRPIGMFGNPETVVAVADGQQITLSSWGVTSQGGVTLDIGRWNEIVQRALSVQSDWLGQGNLTPLVGDVYLPDLL